MRFTVDVDNLANGPGHFLFKFLLRVEIERLLCTAQLCVFQSQAGNHLKHLRANATARGSVVVLLEHRGGEAVSTPEEGDHSFEHFGTMRNVVAALRRLGQEVVESLPLHLGEFVPRANLTLAWPANQLQPLAARLAREVRVRPRLLHSALCAVAIGDLVWVVCDDFFHVFTCPTGVR